MKSRLSEDTLAVLFGLLAVGLGLAPLAGVDPLGWAVAVKEWADPGKALAAAGKGYAGLGGAGAAAVPFAVLTAVLAAGAKLLGEPPGKFAGRSAVLFPLAFLCWVAGHHAAVAATPDKRAAFGLGWSFGLTGEAGYLLALVGGLGVANFLPAAARWLRPAARSELFIKTAIVVYGAVLGAKAAEEAKLTQAVLARGLAAIVEAYLIYWALVYLLARTVFGFSREWAAPLASGISVCGVTAAMATGAAIRARPAVPVMVSSLVVVFAVIEMLVLPAAARAFLADEPLVAAAWMGLAVKTDGAAFASGEMTAAAFYPDPDHPGRKLMTLTTVTVKVCIDVFIGVWAVVLSAVWAYAVAPRADRRLPLAEVWGRFPKFVFGYAATFGGFLAVGLLYPGTAAALKAGTAEADVFRKLFFVLTFFSISLAADFRRLWAEGLGKLALVYAVSLFGFIVWIGLGISWLFFHGVRPPAAGGTP